MKADRTRPLTDAEIEAARLIFSDGIDYTRVRISRGIPLLPPLKVAVAPRCCIYFPTDDCPDDFTAVQAHYRIWLMHELTHVWQYQLGFRPLLGGMMLSLKGGYINRRAYAYPPPAQIASFAALNMEQQADCVAHYYAARHLNWPRYLPDLPHYQRIVQPLLDNPHRPALLPAYTGNLPWRGLAGDIRTAVQKQCARLRRP